MRPQTKLSSPANPKYKEPKRLKIRAMLPLLLPSVILLSTTTVSASSTVSLIASPFQNPGPRGNVVVAVAVSPADGVTSADLFYRYDPTVLTPAGVYRTGYSNGFALTSSTATRGIVEIHLAGSTPLSGSGEVAWVEFQIGSGTGAVTVPSTAVSWISATLNGGAIACQTKGSTVTFGAAPVTIS